MSMVTRLAWLPGLWSVRKGNFRLVICDEIQEPKPKMVEHKLVSFETVLALWILETFNTNKANSHPFQVKIYTHLTLNNWSRGEQ